MSYREHDGQVVLTLSRDDYEKMLLLLGAGTAAMREGGANLESILGFLDRLNEGNPNYRPYLVTDKSNAPRG